MTRQPAWVEPMRATLTKTYFSDPEWIFEPKLDGIRCLAFKRGDAVKLYSRNKLTLTDSYPSIAGALARKRHDFILDGEIAAVSDGRTSFGLLQQARRQEVQAFYFVFDILFLDALDLRKQSLLERKKRLAEALRLRPPLQPVDHIECDGEAFFEAACREGLEGVIAKRADGRYVSARSRDWLKFKCSNEQEFVIVGFTDPQGSRVGLGALLVGYYDTDGLRYAGKVGTGFDTKMLLDLRARLDRLEIDEPAFVNPRGVKRKGSHWVKPELVAQIGFSEWTGDGRLRHPRFVGLRADKDPRDVVREG